MGQSDQKHVVVRAMHNLFFLLCVCFVYKAICRRDRGQIGEALSVLLKLNSDPIETQKWCHSPSSWVFHHASAFDPTSMENNSKFSLIPRSESRAWLQNICWTALRWVLTFLTLKPFIRMACCKRLHFLKGLLACFILNKLAVQSWCSCCYGR